MSCDNKRHPEFSVVAPSKVSSARVNLVPDVQPRRLSWFGARYLDRIIRPPRPDTLQANHCRLAPSLRKQFREVTALSGDAFLTGASRPVESGSCALGLSRTADDTLPAACDCWAGALLAQTPHPVVRRCDRSIDHLTGFRPLNRCQSPISTVNPRCIETHVTHRARYRDDSGPPASPVTMFCPPRDCEERGASEHRGVLLRAVERVVLLSFMAKSSSPSSTRPRSESSLARRRPDLGNSQSPDIQILMAAGVGPAGRLDTSR